MHDHKVVSREEWLVARKKHLAKEKAFTRLRDELSQDRRELFWVKVDKDYLFDGAYHCIDLAPKGRDEDDLPYGLASSSRSI
ncbi:MAG: DUF899 family protein [Desulfobacterales bacterium]